MKTKTTKLRILVFLKTGRVIHNFESRLLKRKTSKIFTRVKNNREALHFNANVGSHHEEFSALGKARERKSKQQLRIKRKRRVRSWLSKKEHKADALALGAEEGRDKLRKAAVRSKYPLTRRYPNEGTQLQ